MRKYKVSYRVSNKAQLEGCEPWSDVKDTEIVEADNEQEAIIFLMDSLADSARSNGYYVETDEEKQEIKVFDNEELIEMYDFFEVADE